jgi:glycosyltransferase involved in cell wall biosynthesis
VRLPGEPPTDASVDALPTIAHVLTPLATDGSSPAHVVRALTAEHQARGGTSYVVVSHNRESHFPDASVLPVDYTRHCPRQYFIRREYAVDALAGAALRSRPYSARIYEPAVEAVSEVAPDWVIVHEGHLATPALGLFASRLRPHTSVAMHAHNFLSRMMWPHEVRHLLRQADRILVVSDYMGERIAQRSPGVTSRLRRVPNGVDLQRFTAGDPRNPSEPRLRLLYVGQVAEHKGVHLVLEALRALGRGAASYELKIIGSAHHLHGEDLSDYERSLRALAGQTLATVTFQAYTPQELLPAEYRDADVVCMPSAAEPFGMVALEAMASGAVVVGSRTGALPEVLGPVGITVDHTAEAWAAALRELDGLDLHQARDRSIERARSFSWGHAHAALVDALRR